LDPNKGFKPKKKWLKDMLVRISDGPFSDFTGKIEDVNDEKETMKVLISLFGRDTPVEIEFGQVEKVQ
jgi:transcriptional antiterminator NusG